MRSKVVDASALACYCFDEPEMTSVETELRSGALFAPSLLYFELANIFWKKLRREPDALDALREQFAVGLAVPIATVPVDYAEIALLAGTSGLTAYDASYLWLARHLDAGLLTLDGRLLRAAGTTLG